MHSAYAPQCKREAEILPIDFLVAGVGFEPTTSKGAIPARMEYRADRTVSSTFRNLRHLLTISSKVTAPPAFCGFVYAVLTGRVQTPPVLDIHVKDGQYVRISLQQVSYFPYRLIVLFHVNIRN